MPDSLCSVSEFSTRNRHPPPLSRTFHLYSNVNGAALKTCNYLNEHKKTKLIGKGYILGGVQYSLGSAQLSSAEKLSVTLNDGFSAPFFLE